MISPINLYWFILKIKNSLYLYVLKVLKNKNYKSSLLNKAEKSRKENYFLKGNRSQFICDPSAVYNVSYKK